MMDFREDCQVRVTHPEYAFTCFRPRPCDVHEPFKREAFEAYLVYTGRSRLGRFFVHYLHACQFLHDWGERATPWNVRFVWSTTDPLKVFEEVLA